MDVKLRFCSYRLLLKRIVEIKGFILQHFSKRYLGYPVEHFCLKREAAQMELALALQALLCVEIMKKIHAAGGESGILAHPKSRWITRIIPLAVSHGKAKHHELSITHKLSVTHKLILCRLIAAFGDPPWVLTPPSPGALTCAVFWRREWDSHPPHTPVNWIIFSSSYCFFDFIIKTGMSSKVGSCLEFLRCVGTHRGFSPHPSD